jgi:hypothetical protein
MAVSIISACMNRNNNLSKVFESWLNLANEIVIVDWGSELSVKDTIMEVCSGIKYNSICDKITIIKVTNVDKWALSPAFNLAAKFATKETLLKLDCDILVSKYFLREHPPNDTVFYCGNWRNARSKEESYLNGLLMCSNAAFNATKYNEYITTYGWDDSDLYMRLEKTLTCKNINNDFVQHLHHAGRCDTDSYVEIQYNRILCEKLKLGAYDSPPADFYETARSIDINNGFMITEITGEITVNCKVPPQVHAATIDALHQMLRYTKPDLYNNLYLKVMNGLGNKLRALASGVSLIDWVTYKCKNKLPWNMTVIWPLDEHCMAAHDDLFTLESLLPSTYVKFVNDINIINSSNNSSNIGNDQCTDRRIRIVSADGPNITTRSLDDKTQDVYKFTSIDNILNAKFSTNIFIESATVIGYPGASWSADCKYLRNLIPSDSVNKLLIKTLEGAPGIESAIGMHIRAGQLNAPDDVSNWDESKKLQWNKWRNSSQYDNFKTIIEKKIELNKDMKIYLASDSEDVYAAALRDFPNNIYYCKRDLYDRSKDQVITGLVDALILSRCKEFYGSNWSSFSELVARFGCKKNYYAGIDF